MGLWKVGAEPRALQCMGSSGQTALSPSTNPHLHTRAEEQPPQPLQLPKAHFISIQFSLQLCPAPSCHAGGCQLSCPMYLLSKLLLPKQDTSTRYL